MHEKAHAASHGADTLGKRLAIDQLRVALSRPTERLIWVDVSPDGATVTDVGRLLRPPSELALLPMTAEALRTSLDEEELDVDERLQRCERDARQLVAVKPDLAWSRAQEAVSLLGSPGEITYVADPQARRTAYLTLCEVCFQLAFRKKSLPPELGRVDLYLQASEAAHIAGMALLASALQVIGGVERAQGFERVNWIAKAVQQLAEAREQLPSWLIVEIASRTEDWLQELDRHFDAGDNPLLAYRILPPFFEALGFSDAKTRTAKLAQRAVRTLMKNRRHAQALSILERLPESQPKLAAECYEETGDFAKAAGIYVGLDDNDKALRCYRSVPDFAAALNLVRRMEGHTARPSLEWLAELDGVLARRPKNFNRAMTAPEKKLLEGMLERGLGVQRKKPAARKAAAKGSQGKTTKKPAPRKRKNVTGAD
jgi:tetratricopeptide (TPR) repeat protein